MLSEGRHEINAIRQRLAAANTRASSATKIMESTRQNLEMSQKTVKSARENFDSSRGEVKDVEALLTRFHPVWIRFLQGFDIFLRETLL